MYHCFGMVMGNLGALTHGASIVFPAPSFDAEKTLQALAQEKCSSIFAVPTMFTQMLAAHGAAPPIPTLRTGLMAGSSCPEKLMLQVLAGSACVVFIVSRYQRRASSLPDSVHSPLSAADMSCRSCTNWAPKKLALLTE